MGQTRD